MNISAIFMNLLEIGVPNLIISFAESFFSAFIIYYFMHKLLPNRLNIYVLTAMALVYASWSVLRKPEFIGTGYHLWMNIFINAWTCFIIVFLFREKFWRKLVVWWYFDIIKAICQAVSFVPIMLYHSHRGFSGEWEQIVSSTESDTMLKLIYMAVFIPLFILLGILSLSLWRRIFMRKLYTFYYLFAVLPMGQLYSLSRVINPNMGDWIFGIMLYFISDVTTIYNILSIFGIAISLLASIATLYYVLAQEKRTAIEAELRKSKRVMELEQTRYREIERRSDELAKIRHDFNNQLASIIQLVKAGEDDTAHDMISALTEEINKTNES